MTETTHAFDTPQYREAVWSDPALLLDACALDLIPSLDLVTQMMGVKARLDAEPANEDGEYRMALRELIVCMDQAVSQYAERLTETRV